MQNIETLTTENPVIDLILHTLAENNLVNIIGDDEEMSETTLHYLLTNYLFNALRLYFNLRDDVFIAANLRVSYDEQKPLKWYAPDVLIAFGVENRERSSYCLWQEKVMPQIVFEIASEFTAVKDLTEKLLAYEKLGVEEYYLLDPSHELLPKPLIAYHLDEDRELMKIKIQNNRIFSPRLNLEIVNTNAGFRLFNQEKNEFLRTPEEMAQRLAELEALLKL